VVGKLQLFQFVLYFVLCIPGVLNIMFYSDVYFLWDCCSLSGRDHEWNGMNGIAVNLAFADSDSFHSVP
jgi:hypothetical protein